MFTTVVERAGLERREELLAPAERVELAALGFGPERRREWVAGRVAVRVALERWLGAGATPRGLTTEPCGAPRLSGREDSPVSLSHDGPWVAVALSARRRVAIDVCSRAHGERLGPILRRLALHAVGLHPCQTWAAVECALKLRRRGITSVLDAAVTVEPRGRQVIVGGIGAPAAVAVTLEPSFALAWGEVAS